jgi:hypothetical protein
MRAPYVVAATVAIIGALIFAGVAIHEWNYYQDHPHRTGVSGVLVWLSIGGFLTSIAVATVAVTIGRALSRPDPDLVERIMK